MNNYQEAKSDGRDKDSDNKKGDTEDTVETSDSDKDKSNKEEPAAASASASSTAVVPSAGSVGKSNNYNSLYTLRLSDESSLR